MERIGDILNRSSSPDASSRREDSKKTTDERNSIVKTEQEARERGVRIRKPQPPDETCEFCGKTLHHDGIIFGSEVFIWHNLAERCDCDKAVEKWAAYDAEQERLKREAELAEQRKRMQARIDRLIGKSGIKKRFQQRTFENFICDTPARKKCYSVAKAYADNFPAHAVEGRGLYIEGTNGTGKTHLAAAIALQLMTENSIPVICKTSSDLLLDIKKTFDSGENSEAQVLNIYKSVDLLVIDDLGKEQCSDWSMSALYSILNDRYEDMKPTIITTNYNSDDLLRALTPKGFDNTKIVAILSRLREVSHVLTMAWDDYRGGK